MPVAWHTPVRHQSSWDRPATGHVTSTPLSRTLSRIQIHLNLGQLQAQEPPRMVAGLPDEMAAEEERRAAVRKLPGVGERRRRYKPSGADAACMQAADTARAVSLGDHAIEAGRPANSPRWSTLQQRGAWR
jgi:hypothetical protein